MVCSFNVDRQESEGQLMQLDSDEEVVKLVQLALDGDRCKGRPVENLTASAAALDIVGELCSNVDFDECMVLEERGLHLRD